MTSYPLDIQARKVPLSLIRERLLLKHLKYMRLTPESAVAAMTREQLLKWLNLKDNSKSEAELRDPAHSVWEVSLSLHVARPCLEVRLHHGNSTRNIWCCGILHWQGVQADESWSHCEYSSRSRAARDSSFCCWLLKCRRPSCTHRGQAYMSLWPVQTEAGLEITDTLRFFTGDHPQFEQETKQGGTYKCGACGCQEYLFDDQSHALQHHWRTPHQLQSLAIAGRFGKEAGSLKLFELKVKELRKCAKMTYNSLWTKYWKE